MSLLAGPTTASVLAEARQAHVAIETKTGPHVTPQLYAADDNDLWFFAASSTLKAKTLKRRPRAGAVVATAGRAVVAIGDVTVFDAADVATVAHRGALPDAARAVARYAVRNAPDLVGFAGAALSGGIGRLVPPRRILFRLRPLAVAVLDDGELSEVFGAWPGADSGGNGGADAVSGKPAVAAWVSAVGPVASPARWDAEAARAAVPAALIDLAPPTSRATSVVVDDYGGPGPQPKRGTLVRGSGVVQRDARGVTIDVTPTRETTWEGTETATRRAV